MKEENSVERLENGPKLNIVFGIDSEVVRIKTTLERLEWYREQGYSESHVKVPTELSKSSSDEEILNKVKAEFSDNKYKDFYEYIETEWVKVSGELEKLKELSRFHLMDTYTVVLTKYGSGGSYNSAKGEVIVNIDSRSKEKIIGTLIHEIIHIGIQHLIDEYNVKHWHKERLVDLLGNKSFPGIREMQAIKEDTVVVDEAFDKFFPDLGAITKAIGTNDTLLNKF